MKLFTVSLLALLVLGCGSNQSDNASQNAGASAPQASSSGCQAVAHSRLEALLPVLPGFSRGMPNGDTDTGEQVSRTTVDYEDRSGGSTISVELGDTCRNENMLISFREALKNG